MRSMRTLQGLSGTVVETTICCHGESAWAAGVATSVTAAATSAVAAAATVAVRARCLTADFGIGNPFGV